ncbi:MAG: cysteine--tRNA ligase [Myxococcota bacterium]
MTELQLYDTFRRSVHGFRPRVPGVATVYSCGPTVYSRQHLGNMRPYVFADLLTRVLRLQGYEVRHVINITDVGHLTDDADEGDDKMERAARGSGDSVLEVARVWTDLFKRDLRLLGVKEPSVWAKASEHIAEQIEMIQVLEERGFTYRLADGIYFDTGRDASYGQLSRLRASLGHARVEAASGKRQPADFALWKFSPKEGPRRQLEWPSPWGVGFPGWHIECSAMATRYLGREIDIHTGGVDHVAVHHTNEIAQSENALGVSPWVQFWMHGAWLTMEGDKISKSRPEGSARSSIGIGLRGDLRRPPNLDDLRSLGTTPAGFRYYLYTAHYRSPLNLTAEALRAAEAARHRLALVAQAAQAAPPELESAPSGLGWSAPPNSEGLRKIRRKFFDALYDDLNAPRALAALWEIVEQPEPLAERGRLVRELAATIGLELQDEVESGSDEAHIEAHIEALVQQREVARRARDFALSDALRAELSTHGVLVEDLPNGSRWRRVPV